MNFISPEITLCADSYSMFVPPFMLPQWHVKDPGQVILPEVQMAGYT